MTRRFFATLCAACAFFPLGCGNNVVATHGTVSTGGSTTTGGNAGACSTGEDIATFGVVPGFATVGIATGPGGVYWTNTDGSVWTAGSAGASPHAITSIAGSGQILYTLALDAASVYVVEYASALWKVDQNGGSSVPLVGPEVGVVGVAADDTGVYFTAIDGVRWVDSQGGAPKLLAAVEDADSIVVDDTFVYVRTVGNTGDSTNRVVRVPKLGGAPVDIAPPEPGPLHYFSQEIAVDATGVYWVNPAAGTISKVDKAGGTPVVLASGLADPVSVAADSGFVYFSVRGKNGGPLADRAVGKVSTAGGPMAYVAHGPCVSAFGLALDATRAYWTQYGVSQGVATADK